MISSDLESANTHRMASRLCSLGPSRRKGVADADIELMLRNTGPGCSGSKADARFDADRWPRRAAASSWRTTIYPLIADERGALSGGNRYDFRFEARLP